MASRKCKLLSVIYRVVVKAGKSDGVIVVVKAGKSDGVVVVVKQARCDQVTIRYRNTNVQKVLGWNIISKFLPVLSLLQLSDLILQTCA